VTYYCQQAIETIDGVSCVVPRDIRRTDNTTQPLDGFCKTPPKEKITSSSKKYHPIENEFSDKVNRFRERATLNVSYT